MLIKILKEALNRMSGAAYDLNPGRMDVLIAMAVLIGVALIVLFILAVNKRIRFFSGAVSLLTAASVFTVCIFYPDVELLYAHPEGDPVMKADTFLNALSAGQTSEAYDVMYGGGVSGTSSVPEDETSAMYYRLLTENFGYEDTVEVTVHDRSAQVPVRISYADLAIASASVDELFDVKLDAIIQEHSRREVFNDDDSYQDWVIEEAYLKASSDVLSAAPVTVSKDIVIDLEFTDGAWNIVPSEDLLNILGGGVCFNPSSEKNLSDKIVLFSFFSKSNILADLIYIPKLYSIPEDAARGYEPAEDKYFELADPFLIDEAVADSEHLIKGADLVFDPNVTFAPGQPIYYYADDSIFAIVWKEYCNNCYCNFAEVFISDPSQLRRKIAGDTFGYGVQLYASSMAADANAVVAMNGDFYKFRPLGLCVYDRTVYRCEAASLDTCFFDTKGNMIFSYAGELTDKDEAQRFVDENDILFSVSFGPVLIDNGVPKEDLRYRIGETMQSYSRSSIGQLGEGHYLLMTIGHVYPYKECCPLKGAQDIMLLKGCINAYTLDGGQTAEIIWRDRPYSYVDWGVERTISDIIYFATAVPEDEQ